MVELMVVVVIIGVLTAIAIPFFNNVQTNSRRNAHNANVRILQGSAAQMLAENTPLAATVTWNSTPTTGTPRPATAWENYLNAWPVNPLTNAPDYVVNITPVGVITVIPAAAP